MTLVIDDMIDSVLEVSSQEHDVSRINSIAEKDSPYAPLRQDSKVPTFLLTYGGTYIGMMAQCSFPEAKARQIEDRYHDLYKVSDQWVSDRLDEASQRGYVKIAFGLRLRTPLLKQVIRGTSATPYEAQAEGRTAGNALGQSWGLLNTRASVEFMQTVRAGPHRLDIRPICHVHDSQYYLIRDDVGLVRYVNHHLVKAVEWQEDPLIFHEIVKLGGELSIFHPSWAHEAVIANGASEEDIFAAIDKHFEKLAEKGVSI